MSRISDLIAIVAERYEMSVGDTEKFVQTMVDVMNDGLREEKLLKVKGLGTFKVTSVNARESVDISTGERIVIEGRDKISFTPDTVMRDLVNKPFAQFETVVVNEGVNFDEIDAKYRGESHEDPQVEPHAELQAAPQVELGESQVEEVQPQIEETQPQVAHLVQSEPIEEPAPVEEVNDEEIEVEKNDNKIEKEMENNQEEKFDEYGYLIEEENDPKVLKERLKKKNKVMIWLMGFVALMVIACALGMYFMYQEMKERDERIENLIKQLEADKGHPKKGQHLANNHSTVQMDRAKQREEEVRKETLRKLAEYDQLVIDSAEAGKRKFNKYTKEVEAAEVVQGKVIDDQNKMFKKEAEKRKAEESRRAEITRKEDAKRMAEISKKAEIGRAMEKSNQKSNQNYDQDPRVRLGAYVITGVSKIVTVQQGQTLASISKAHLGPGMECYVEAINGGIKQVKPGQQIKIPSLKPKKQVKK